MLKYLLPILLAISLTACNKAPEETSEKTSEKAAAINSAVRKPAITGPETPAELKARREFLNYLFRDSKGQRYSKEIVGMPTLTKIEFYPGRGYLFNIGIPEKIETMYGVELKYIHNPRVISFILDQNAALQNLSTASLDNNRAVKYYDRQDPESAPDLSNSLTFVRLVLEDLELKSGQAKK